MKPQVLPLLNMVQKVVREVFSTKLHNGFYDLGGGLPTFAVLLEIFTIFNLLHETSIVAEEDSFYISSE